MHWYLCKPFIHSFDSQSNSQVSSLKSVDILQAFHPLWFAPHANTKESGSEFISHYIPFSCFSYFAFTSTSELQACCNELGGRRFLLLQAVCNMSNHSHTSIVKPFIFHLESKQKRKIRIQTEKKHLWRKKVRRKSLHECCYGQRRATLRSESWHQLFSIQAAVSHVSFPL